MTDPKPLSEEEIQVWRIFRTEDAQWQRLIATIDQLRKERDAARSFVEAIMCEAWEYGDHEGAQELALRYGLISEVAGGYNPNEHNDLSGVAEPGDTFYMLAWADAQ